MTSACQNPFREAYFCEGLLVASANHLYRAASLSTPTTEEPCPRFRPGVHSAARAGVLRFARCLFRSRFALTIVAELDIGQCEAPLVDELHARNREASPRLNVVTDPLSGLLTARLTCRGRDQPHCPHHLGPFTVVIARAGRGSKMMLLEMDHLMDQGRERFFGGAAGEMTWVQCDLVGDLLTAARAEAAASEVAVGLTFSAAS